LAFHRIRLTTALLAVLVTLAVAFSGSASAAGLRVEGPRGTVFQGNVIPFVGTLRDQDGIPHTTTKSTALGALVTASRKKPFPITLSWFSGMAWDGFFVNSINHVGLQGSSFWAVKVDQKLLGVGAGAAVVTPQSHVLYYYTTSDPNPPYATEQTLGLVGPGHVTVGALATYTVSKYDDNGVATPAANAWIWVNGVGTKTDGTGKATIRLGKPGLFSVRATLQGTIRSRTLWVRAVSS
jgi:hypothetical protein